MTEILLAIAALGAALAAFLVYRHERVHCHQIGELQHLLADLTEHIGDRTADPLPEQLAEHVACMRGQHEDDGRTP